MKKLKFKERLLKQKINRLFTDDGICSLLCVKICNDVDDVIEANGSIDSIDHDLFEKYNYLCLVIFQNWAGGPRQQYYYCGGQTKEECIRWGLNENNPFKNSTEYETRNHKIID